MLAAADVAKVPIIPSALCLLWNIQVKITTTRKENNAHGLQMKPVRTHASMLSNINKKRRRRLSLMKMKSTWIHSAIGLDRLTFNPSTSLSTGGSEHRPIRCRFQSEVCKTGKTCRNCCEDRDEAQNQQQHKEISPF